MPILTLSALRKAEEQLLARNVELEQALAAQVYSIYIYSRERER